MTAINFIFAIFLNSFFGESDSALYSAEPFESRTGKEFSRYVKNAYTTRTPAPVYT